jgi:hypothetical protein
MQNKNMLWTLIAPVLASYAFFALSMPCNFAESWNSSFEDIRRGFEMLGGKASREGIHEARQREGLATNGGFA